jgi:RNA polymerase sigma-70 factor (ECF subfamily)
VFVKVHQALAGFRGEASLSTWLYRIATNAGLDRLRGASGREMAQAGLSDEAVESGEAELDDREAWTGEKTPSLEQQLARTEMNRCIRDFVEQLPEHYRTVLVLSELEGLPNKEIAEVLGVSLATVKIRLHRAREKLKAELLAHCDTDWAEQNEFVPDLRRVP